MWKQVLEQRECEAFENENRLDAAGRQDVLPHVISSSREYVARSLEGVEEKVN